MSAVESNEMEISAARRLLTGLTALLLLATYASLYQIVPQFSQVFASLGSDLPGLTLFVISNYAYFIVIPLLGAVPTLVIAFSSRLRTGIGTTCIRLAAVSFIAGFGGLLLVHVAMYLPILALSRTI